MSRKLWSLVVASGLGLSIVVVSQLVGGGTQQTEELAVLDTDIALAVVDSYPDPGFCRAVLVYLQTCTDADDAGRGLPCAKHYAVCEFPRDAGEEPDPDTRTRAEKFEVYIHGKCAVAAKKACATDVRPNKCIQESVDQCENAAYLAGSVKWSSEPYAITTETKQISALTPKQAQQHGGCACAPDPVKLGDSGLLPCLEWVDWTDRDGGQWKRAPPGKILTKWLRPLCEPAPCEETAARESVEGCTEPFGAGCSVPEICRVPRDAGTPGLDAAPLDPGNPI